MNKQQSKNNLIEYQPVWARKQNLINWLGGIPDV
jgi:hypothetical protein